MRGNYIYIRYKMKGKLIMNRFIQELYDKATIIGNDKYIIK